MPRHLLILRHAKSAWNTDAPSDFERPLAKRGKKDAPRLGRRLRKRDMTPDYVISSPARRARQTTIRVCKKLGIKKKQIHWDERIYEGGTRQLLTVLSGCPKQAKTVMLVGHNPGLEELLEYLCGPQSTPEDGKLLPTATAVDVQMPKNWKKPKAGTARLLSVTRPRK